MPTAEILSQGDEVVTGQIADTNAAWLSERLLEQGFDVVRHTTVGDRMADLVAVIGEIAARADVCLCTGGLGPTEDDLTAEAFARAFDAPVALDPVALEQIEERFRSMGRTMSPVNRKQALLPQGSVRLDNDWGTAPGFALVGGRCWFACMPGVPREMRQLWEHRVLPLLADRFELRPGRRVILRTIGVGESDLQTAMLGWSAEGVTVGYRTKLPENHLKLWFEATVPEDEVVARVREVLERAGRWTYTIEGLPEVADVGVDAGGGTLAAAVGRRLLARGETLALAESCTGGRIASACTAVAGASAWLLEGLVTYSNAAKVRLLGVSEADLEAHGAVSEVVARAMASGVRERSGATWGVGITGIAGPSGGTPDKPVGTVHVAVASPDRVLHRALRLPGDRDRIQSLAVASALELLRRQLHASN
ncbi:MAG: CinA family nicotinamide mononucleotide deamidase-related protein [Alphaproteobacteria bacterium]|nr:CinA family nicotinamide mononucleotide deamidase-related protein [Alphaproteobacteria bacterium]MCB9698892.1 CinA family nicotinamide mononucleotide deamidase-related protein [Alphaproteobacteria bacterium]